MVFSKQTVFLEYNFSWEDAFSEYGLLRKQRQKKREMIEERERKEGKEGDEVNKIREGRSLKMQLFYF